MTLNEKLSVLLKEHYNQTGDSIQTINIEWSEVLGRPPLIYDLTYNARSHKYIEGETK